MIEWLILTIELNGDVDGEIDNFFSQSCAASNASSRGEEEGLLIFWCLHLLGMHASMDAAFILPLIFHIISPSLSLILCCPLQQYLYIHALTISVLLYAFWICCRLGDLKRSGAGGSLELRWWVGRHSPVSGDPGLTFLITLYIVGLSPSRTTILES